MKTWKVIVYLNAKDEKEALRRVGQNGIGGLRKIEVHKQCTCEVCCKAIGLMYEHWEK